MNWISPTFDNEAFFTQPPKKRSKTRTLNEKNVETVITNILPKSSCNWHEQYKPKNIPELVIHVKKINELEAWVKQSPNDIARTKFLLLTGPPGCGKTTMLQTVCKSNGIKIQEWITPLDRPDEETEFQSRFDFKKSEAKLFEEYIFKSSRYNSCLGSSLTKKLVLIKDFPNVILHSPSTFHEILENLADKCMTPVVFISSDDSLCRKLFPPTLKTECKVQSLPLNAVTDQRMFKILKQINLQESKSDKRVSMLSDDELMDIVSSCQGDLRLAISKLFFQSINGSGLKLPVTPKRGLKNATLVCKSSPTAEYKKLDFFHGVGRVLYPKRIESAEGLKFVHSAESIVESFQSEAGGFLSQLQENYPGRMGDLAALAEAAGRLATCDLLRSRWQERDIFSHYSLAVAVRGLMVANRAPRKTEFQAFRKSNTSRLEVDNKAIELEGKMLFSDLHVLDYQSLIDILPYAKLLLLNLDQGHLEYIRKTSVFKS